MATITAYKSIDMSTGLSFYEVDPSNLLKRPTATNVEISDPDGNRQIYRGTFKYIGGNLNWGASKLTGFEQYDASGNIYWKVQGLSVSGTIYNNFASTSQGMALMGWSLRGNDTIIGSQYNDVLLGADGNDTIKAGAGDDWLIGGSGVNALTGGLGADKFYFDDTYGGTKKSKASTLTDFSISQSDKIVVEDDTLPVEISSATKVSIFTGVAGQFTVNSIRGGILLSVDWDGDRKADHFLNVLGVNAQQFTSDCVEFI
jgi:Ca2+-binding RTX toxin-like protein